jgi:hypothetical protein
LTGEGPDHTARRLIRAGFSDEHIETQTGLPLIRLMELRALAASNPSSGRARAASAEADRGRA